MMKLSSTTSDIKVKIFSGNAEKVEKEMSEFMKEKKIKISGFAQSQSSLANSPEGMLQRRFYTLNLKVLRSRRSVSIISICPYQPCGKAQPLCIGNR
jgi:hypothetical protein